jgi:hypothetical protein
MKQRGVIREEQVSGAIRRLALLKNRIELA